MNGSAPGGRAGACRPGGIGEGIPENRQGRDNWRYVSLLMEQ